MINVIAITTSTWLLACVLWFLVRFSDDARIAESISFTFAICILCAICGIFGASLVIKKVKKEAVKKGHAEYKIVDPLHGKTKWQWKEEENE